MLTARFLGWVAGFLEGEGSFVLHGQRGSAKVQAVQVQREPLDRLKAAFGGQIYVNSSWRRPPHKPIHVWYCYGPTALGVMMTVYSMMSPKRKLQIRTVLDRWRSRPGQKGSSGRKLVCPKGHPYDEKNTIVQMLHGTKRRRKCRECWNQYQRNRRVLRGLA